MLDKRALRKIPCEEAGEEIVRTAKEKLAEHIKFIMTVGFTAEDKKILLLTFYRVEDLKENRKKAVMRTFLSKDDYITQDMRMSNTKWLTGSFRYMNYPVDIWCWWRSPGGYSVHILCEHEKILKEFFKAYSELHDSTVWRAVFRFQDEIKAKRLSVKHDKEKVKIDAVMNRMGELPEGFKSWCRETVLGFSRYLIYKDIGKGKALCRCTHCETTGEVERSSIYLKHKINAVCPFCGSKVTVAAEGMFKRFRDTRRAAFVEHYNNGFVIRIFYCIREGGAGRPTKEYMFEDIRIIYEPKGNGFEQKAYEWANFKNTTDVRWCEDTGKIYLRDFCLFPGNLPQAWAHTSMRYSALEILSKNIDEPINYLNAIHSFVRFPKLEWIIKMGLYRLAKERADYLCGPCGMNESGETIYEILDLKKPEVKLLEEINGGSEALNTLHWAREHGIRWRTDEAKEFIETFGNNHGLMWELQRTTVHKLMKFINREYVNYKSERENCGQCLPMSPINAVSAEIQGKRNLAADWLDYLRWRRKMHRDTLDDFNYFPKNFQAVHDREHRDYQAMQDRRRAEERALEERRLKIKNDNFRAVLTEILSTGSFETNGQRFVIVVPKDSNDIRREGETLHHCVATYIERVAKGETNILFVRKKSDPDTPFYTLEYKNGKVIQCRGMRNKGMPEEVAAFVNGFAKMLLDKAEEMKENSKNFVTKAVM